MSKKTKIHPINLEILCVNEVWSLKMLKIIIFKKSYKYD